MKINYFKYKMYISRLETLCVFLVFNFGTSIIAQEVNKEKQKVLKESKEFLSEANYEMENDNFFLAEELTGKQLQQIQRKILVSII